MAENRVRLACLCAENARACSAVPPAMSALIANPRTSTRLNNSLLPARLIALMNLRDCSHNRSSNVEIMYAFSCGETTLLKWSQTDDN